ncbi:response regulator [Metabacillus sp. GX 13764]|uniref:response regulator n=1 Tax=Metabacillus kandeliae TaxID=2900151 RepID=UPI001E4C4CFB|nr:response regulator [Metabacillus kandeliae]MCD7036352.1 response regulator [Metabacillus kandeliae]
MYTLFIADDEKIVIDGLTQAIDWNKHEINIVGTALNGSCALSQIKDKHPDIVLADIRMPGLSGLELIREAKKENLNTEFIIISGYSEFSYAKEALELEAVDYLVKPIEAGDIVYSVKKAIGKLEKRRDNKQLDLKLARYERESEKQKLQEIMLGNIPFHHKISLQEYTPYYILAGHTIGEADERESRLLEIEECLYQKGNALFFSIGDGKFAMLLKDSDPIFEYATVGISQLYTSAENIHTAYLEAKEALEVGVFSGRSAVKYEEIRIEETKDERKISRKIEAFFDKPIQNFFKETMTLINEVIDEFYSSNISPQRSKYLCFKLASQFRRKLSDYFEGQLTGEEEYILYNKVASLQSLKEAKAWLCQLVEEAEDYSKQNKVSYNEKLILEIKEYLKEHYHEPIVLEELGKTFCKSPAYLCALFSKSAGTTIFEYITSIRMKEAKKLLRTTNYKVTQIGVMSGYNHSKYFNQVFKKNEGITPSQYRTRHYQ